jgi:hypothetical protein
MISLLILIYFQITYDYEPVLIEINAVPALYFSLTVQEMITRRLLEDVIRVVVDHSRNPGSYTGEFECIHSEPIPWCDNSHNLTINGKGINRTLPRRHTAPAQFKVPLNVKQNTDTINRLNSMNNRYIYLKSL